jgi:hypothetical protein
VFFDFPINIPPQLSRADSHSLVFLIELEAVECGHAYEYSVCRSTTASSASYGEFDVGLIQSLEDRGKRLDGFRSNYKLWVEILVGGPYLGLFIVIGRRRLNDLIRAEQRTKGFLNSVHVAPQFGRWAIIGSNLKCVDRLLFDDVLQSAAA